MNRPSPPVSTRRLIAGLLGPPVAWALHIGLIYPLVLLACRLGDTAVLHAVTVVMAAATLAFGASSLLLLRRLPATRQDERTSQERFLARAGIFSGALFFVVIVVEGAPVLFHDPCA